MGGGASTLVDDLLALGHADASVRDVSAKAIDARRLIASRGGRRITLRRFPLLPGRAGDTKPT
ncbi:MAG TPA: hypothetical protein VKZ18_27215 [Polyangia bacterium]|nr:hypothetical protein [Polyangia bacterium]